MYQRAKKVASNNPGPSGFCYRASELCSYLAQWVSEVFEEFKLQKYCEINSSYQNVFGAS